MKITLCALFHELINSALLEHPCTLQIYLGSCFPWKLTLVCPLTRKLTFRILSLAFMNSLQSKTQPDFFKTENKIGSIRCMFKSSMSIEGNFRG